jgi:hypothetical protein
MPTEKAKVAVPNLGILEGTKVALKESTERWTELSLDDGAILRVKPVIVSVIRIDGRYDPEGNPLYAIQGGQVMVVASVPDHLKQNPTKDQKVQ